MPSILELQDLYNEALIRELIEKTKSCAITWTHLSGTQFRATQAAFDANNSPVTWDYYITKTQIGNLSYKYTMDVKKGGVNHLTIVNGPLPHTSRDSASKDLYEIVEIIVLQLDVKLKEAIRVVQDLEGCNG
jgi:hypothetical protein